MMLSTNVSHTEATGATATVPCIYTIVLNWNGWRDTLACLESLHMAAYAALVPVIVDNGSTDDSVAQIVAWAGQTAPDSRPRYALEQYTRANGALTPLPGTPDHASTGTRLILIRTGENLGFAAGNNVGLAFALAQPDAAYIWLLNNDTVITPTAPALLVAALAAHPELDVLTPQIRLYAQPDRIWNCGGYLTRTASRRYLYGGAPVAAVPTQGLRRITFITGCALFARAQLWRDAGLLTERFFFGEEDYEYSRRMHKRGRGLACCFEAVIYHKVGATVKGQSDVRQLGRIYIYYLNRFTHMRTEWPRPLWNLWRFASCAYIIPMLCVRYRLSLTTAAVLLRGLLRDSAHLDGVSRAVFDAAMRMTVHSPS